MAFVFQNNEDGHLPSSSSSAPQDLHDVSQFLMRRSMSYSGLDRAEEFQPDDDMSDDGCQILGEKKRRLRLEQVKTLEKSFVLGNKLEPERKMQLSRALGLQPRQIAIWFQNRRARGKTKQLEKDYDVLKRQFESLKADNDALKSQNNKLHSQLMARKNRKSIGSETLNNNEGSWSNNKSDDNRCQIVNLNKTSRDGKNNVVSTSSVDPGDAEGLTQFFDSSSKPDKLIQDQRIDNINDPFCNYMFSGMEGNYQDFWA